MEVLWWVVILGSLVGPDLRVRAGNPDAKRLYDDLLSNYNKLVRPVVNVSEAVTVRLKLKLSQLIDVVSPYYTVREETMQYTDLMTCNIQCAVECLITQSCFTIVGFSTFLFNCSKVQNWSF